MLKVCKTVMSGHEMHVDAVVKEALVIVGGSRSPVCIAFQRLFLNDNQQEDVMVLVTTACRFTQTSRGGESPKDASPSRKNLHLHLLAVVSCE